MDEIIFITRKDLQSEILAALEAHENKMEAKKADKLRSINYVAKKLGLANATVKGFVKKGIIKSTKSGLIKESEIKVYLENK